jgi:LCP family protein required for cell wall assembly
MKKVEETTKKKVKHLNFRLLSGIMIIFSFVKFFLLIKSKLFSILTLILIGAVFFIINGFFVKALNSKLKLWVKNFLSIFVIAIVIGELVFFVMGNKAIDFLSSIVDTGVRTYTYNVYVLDKSDYHELKDLNNKLISYITNDNINDINKELNKTIQYKTRISDDTNKLMEGIINEEVDAIILDESYVDVIKEYNETDFNKLRKIYSFEVTTKIKVEKNSKNLSNTPFVVYISGIDTTGKISSNARSDVNILLAVNPNTKKIAIVSTPRDYYVELPSKGKKDKLTHAGLYGLNESMKSLGKLYDVNVDYYLRINFTSFIDIIDTIGGIEVDIEDDFCESNEERSLNKSDLICLQKGKRTISGREALAYARNRHAFAKGDISRGNHQMEIISAMINKMGTKDVLKNYSKLIDALKGKVLTNINIDDLYKIAKKELKDESSYQISSYTPEIKDMNKLAECYSIGDWGYVLIGKEESVNDISTHLKEVLSN